MGPLVISMKGVLLKKRQILKNYISINLFSFRAEYVTSKPDTYDMFVSDEKNCRRTFISRPINLLVICLSAEISTAYTLTFCSHESKSHLITNIRSACIHKDINTVCLVKTPSYLNYDVLFIFTPFDLHRDLSLFLPSAFGSISCT